MPGKEHASYNEEVSLLQFIAEHFKESQIILLFLGVGTAFLMLKRREAPSQFRVREADRKDLNQILGKKDSDLATAKLIRKTEKPKAPPPLALPGMRLNGESHEILGVAENAPEVEIMRAYKDAIKRFHPDRIQGQAQEQMQFYQEASAKLNQAKDEMLKRIRGR